MTTTNRPVRRATALLALSLAASTLPGAGRCAADDTSPIRAYYNFVYGISAGRPDLALEQFADDAVVVAGPSCTQADPCVGKAAIRNGYFAALAAGRVQLPVRDQRFDGQQLRTRGETIVQDEPREGVVRLRGGHVFGFREGRIASLHVEFDTRDKETAAFVARHAAKAAIARR